MAGTHNFQVFDSAASNMTSDANYASNTARAAGVSNGIADPMLANKAWHQASIVTTAIAQFLANQGNSIDDTNLAGIITAITNSMSGATQLGCTKPGTAYLLTGTLASSGLMPCLFTAPAAYVAGNTFTVNGTAYAVSTSDGVALASGAFASGTTIPITLDVENHIISITASDAKTVNGIALSNDQIVHAYTCGAKVGTVFPLTGDGLYPALIRFSAGQTYNAGDTFTINGVATAAYMSDAQPLTQGFFHPYIYIYATYGGTGSGIHFLSTTNGGHATSADLAANTTSIAGALTVSTSEPTTVLPAGTLWAVV